LARAFSITFSVSAAKPTTTAGRSVVRRATVARMSGFSVRVSAGTPPPLFLILWWAAAPTRQSDTAAAKMAMSAGRAASTASSMS
jgi:hypothetical protein